MLKGLSGLLAVVLVTTSGIGHAFCEECLSTAALWGGDDPHFLYYCDPATNETASAPCGAGKGFISNEETQGCVDWADWSSACIGQEPISASTCNGTGAMQPHAFGDPSNFYLCLAEGTVPVELTCQTGYGFYSGNKYLGCFPWGRWREITGCVNKDVA